MIAAIILCGLGLIPRVDTVEINRFGPSKKQQVIIWQWRSAPQWRGHRVSEWWLASDVDAVRTPGGWRVTAQGRVIDCRRVIWTETQHDPEHIDRSVLPMSERSAVFFDRWTE